MTERTNRLLGSNFAGGTPSFVTVYDQQVPTEIFAYCAWLNAKEKRRGTWIVVRTGQDGPRTVEWREEVASDDWLRERGIVPAIGKAA